MPNRAERTRAVQDLDVPRYKIADVEGIIGLTIGLIHHVANKKLQIDGWRIGQGKARLLSTADVVAFRMLAQTHLMLPSPALRDLVAIGRDYLRACTSNPALMDLPAIILGYRTTSGAWFFLLGHGAKWPQGSPPMAGQVTITLRIKELMLDVLRQLGRLAEAVERAPPGDDLMSAATALASKGNIAADAAA